MRFDPPVLYMGPVLPYTPQGDSHEVTVTNESAWDVEIFSLDFDKVGFFLYLFEIPVVSTAAAAIFVVMSCGGKLVAIRSRGG